MMERRRREMERMGGRQRGGEGRWRGWEGDGMKKRVKTDRGGGSSSRVVRS